MKRIFLLSGALVFCCTLFAQDRQADSLYIVTHYTKSERMIPMRDGVRLFTSIYIPKDTTEKHPILMERTPYSCAPYGEDRMKTRRLGPDPLLLRDNYIIVYQDVRGRYRSEGRFEEMTPAIDHKRSNKEVDESSDTWDTVDWLLKSIRGNNGKVGLWGISYPGFYAAASLPGAHPAVKAVSPQAPMADEFVGNDVNHGGAFFLLDNFEFENFFDHPRPHPWEEYPPLFPLHYADAYRFFLNMGPVSNANKIYYHHQSRIWNEYVEHSTYDAYWQARNIRPHLKDIRPAVLLVGGWFDAEDLFGSLSIYQAITRQSPATDCRLIMGPWTHGAWAGGHWDHFGVDQFGSNTGAWFWQRERDFFNYYLKGEGNFDLPKASIFVTGSNEWKSYDRWPPEAVKSFSLYLQPRGGLSDAKPSAAGGSDAYFSDPSRPVPYMNVVQEGRNNEYMNADQRFASRRPDVLVYATPPLESDLTFCGPLKASLFVSMTGTDADFVVKLIDVYPEDTAGKYQELPLSGYEQLVRADVLRGKFRNSWEHPEPFFPGRITPVSVELQDIAHTFRKGHRIMVQVQSSWFPLVDRNPQRFMNIPDAGAKDFRPETIRVYHDAAHPSSLTLERLED